MLSTHYEGMPLALLEGHGRRLRGGRQRGAGVREVLDDGIDGLLVAEADPAALPMRWNDCCGIAGDGANGVGGRTAALERHGQRADEPAHEELFSNWRAVASAGFAAIRRLACPGMGDDGVEVGIARRPAQLRARGIGIGHQCRRIARAARPMTTGIGCPVTRHTASITSLTEKPLPLPRLPAPLRRRPPAVAGGQQVRAAQVLDMDVVAHAGAVRVG